MLSSTVAGSKPNYSMSQIALSGLGLERKKIGKSIENSCMPRESMSFLGVEPVALPRALMWILKLVSKLFPVTERNL